jgi:hypothetical protein
MVYVVAVPAVTHKMTLHPLSKQQLALVENEIKLHQINFEDEIKNLKEWIKHEPHLPNYRGTVYSSRGK